MAIFRNSLLLVVAFECATAIERGKKSKNTVVVHYKYV